MTLDDVLISQEYVNPIFCVLLVYIASNVIGLVVVDPMCKLVWLAASQVGCTGSERATCVRSRGRLHTCLTRALARLAAVGTALALMGCTIASRAHTLKDLPHLRVAGIIPWWSAHP